jgi:hypothetical protein
MSASNDYQDDLTCTECGGERPPGGDLCPRCEDLHDHRTQHRAPAMPYNPNPPHGNTTR